MEARLHDLALHVRNLLDCDQVHLCLCCPERTLSHPLLKGFSSHQRGRVKYYGSPVDSALFPGAQVWALCDMALQSGACISSGELHTKKGTTYTHNGCIVVAVLERPAGILGFLFCISRQIGAFRQGEYRLLRQYLPELSQLVEHTLNMYSTTQNVCSMAYSGTKHIQEQNAFISMVSHELRVPLTAIKGYAGLLQTYDAAEAEDGRHAMNPTRRQHYLDVIMQQTSHLEVLIGDVLDISHIQSGRLTLHCTSIDLAQLCRSITQLMQYRIDQQEPERYRILCTIDADLPYAWADADRVQQILTNLIENAIKYSPAGGLIEVLVSTHPNYIPDKSDATPAEQPENQRLISSSHEAVLIYIMVRDHGIGIPRQQQTSLFKPFVRLEHPSTKHVRGAGLGLYIAYKLAEAMYGQLILNSSEGKGTSITFTLPAASIDAQPPTSLQPASISL